MTTRFETLAEARQTLVTTPPHLTWQDAPIRKDGVNALSPATSNRDCSGNLDILPCVGTDDRHSVHCEARLVKRLTDQLWECEAGGWHWVEGHEDTAKEK